jgi:hypothetical protein
MDVQGSVRGLMKLRSYPRLVSGDTAENYEKSKACQVPAETGTWDGLSKFVCYSDFKLI